MSLVALAKVHNVVTAQRGGSLCAFLLIELPIYYVVVELDALDGTKLGDDRQNVCLLFGEIACSGVRFRLGIGAKPLGYRQMAVGV
jgi:hypothetical protein